MTVISFVCTGNICRSPTAEVVMRSLVHEAGLDSSIVVESAGVEGYHAGDRADARSIKTMQRSGYDGNSHRARQFERSDFDRVDLIVAMDATHLRDLKRLAPDEAARGRVVLLGDFSADDAGDPDVPDPYYGRPDGFADVLARIERGCGGLLAQVTAR